ncbi:MAG TPA: hypothetical protein VK928_08480 [Longimicrobiales bacterium]|nr:hypothetical protein [Longimicrobiales bacterium]
MANQAKGVSSFISVGVAIVAVVLFLGWLATRERPAEVAVEEPDSAAAPAAPAGGPATVVEADSLTRSAFVRSMMGQDVELRGMPVSTAMGGNFFWIDLPNGQPFLVKLDSAMIAAGQTAPGSGAVNITGRITAKDAALLDQWRQAGVLESDDHKMQAEFGSSFIEARLVQPAGN